MWLFIAFLAIPLIEIALFIQIGGIIGLGWTLLTVVVTAILGTILVRNQGALALGQLRSSFQEMNDPTEPLAHGAMILFSGALLLTPGFFTDGVGFLLLIPAFRSWAFRFVRSRVQIQTFSTAGPSRSADSVYRGQANVIDGEFEEVSPPTGDPKRPSRWTEH